MKCKKCEIPLTEETTYTFEGISFCKDCFEQQTVICDHCRERIWRENAEGNNDTVLCPRCYDNYYTHCDDCGVLISNDEACWEDGEDIPYCERCFEQMQSNARIHPYGYKPDPIFYGSGPLYLGVELEVDIGGEYGDNAEKLTDIANFENDHLYAKHDGSINDGFELVSHPMTLEYHTDTMPWKEVFEKAIDLGYRSHQTTTCGLHCHVNRSAFGCNEQEQEKVIARIVYFVEKHWDELLRFSRRTELSINRWASRYGIAESLKETYKNAKDKRMGRYVAVNLENYHTVEFRLFRGTLRYETFLATLQLVELICRNCIMLTDEALEKQTWQEFTKAAKQKELTAYLKSRQL